MRPHDPAFLFPEDRFDEIAAILARGVRCLLDRPAGTPPDPPSAPAECGNSAQNSLELVGDPRLTVQSG